MADLRRPATNARPTTRKPAVPVVPVVPVTPVTPLWAQFGSLGLAVGGLAVSAYLTYEHFTASTTLACSANGTIDCLKVTTSAQAYLLGIPVAVLGLVFFVAMVALTLPVAWRSGRREVRLARLGAVAVGVVMVMYLVYAELFLVNAICLWCTAVHAITVALFVVLVLAAVSERTE